MFFSIWAENPKIKKNMTVRDVNSNYVVWLKSIVSNWKIDF